MDITSNTDKCKREDPKSPSKGQSAVAQQADRSSKFLHGDSLLNDDCGTSFLFDRHFFGGCRVANGGGSGGVSIVR